MLKAPQIKYIMKGETTHEYMYDQQIKFYYKKIYKKLKIINICMLIDNYRVSFCITKRTTTTKRTTAIATTTATQTFHV